MIESFAQLAQKIKRTFIGFIDHNNQKFSKKDFSKILTISPTQLKRLT